MEYKIQYLASKIRQLKSSPSTELIHEIEALLREIKCGGQIPLQQRRSLTNALKMLSDTYDSKSCSDVPHLVLSIVKMLDNGQTPADAGVTAAKGQDSMRRNIQSNQSTFRLLNKFGINLWHK